ncbi:hypothetical protein BYT27DRAFT_7216740 [Phlegmacium glaucopus]|nr:hypothetical protein BYT27DRAFT_7216740 [Phlegmacium glaucopus]
MIIFYLVPYAVFTGIIIEVLTLGILNPTAVLRKPDGYFCLMSIRVPVRIISTIVICSVIASLVLGGWEYPRSSRNIFWQPRRHTTLMDVLAQTSSYPHCCNSLSMTDYHRLNLGMLFNFNDHISITIQSVVWYLHK